MTECKNCDNCSLMTNECLSGNGKCYKDGICLHYDCKEYIDGTWCTEELEEWK